MKTPRCHHQNPFLFFHWSLGLLLNQVVNCKCALNKNSLFCCRIVERGYYSERDAAHVIKQILEAVAVRLLPSAPSLTISEIQLASSSFQLQNYPPLLVSVWVLLASCSC